MPLQATIQFGKIFEGTTEPQWSSEIYLSELRQTAANFFQTDRDSVSLHPHSAVSFNVFYPARNQCLQFALTSKIRKDIIIITVKERFCVHNFAGIMMNCVPTLCEDESEYVSANYSYIKMPLFYAIVHSRTFRLYLAVFAFPTGVTTCRIAMVLLILVVSTINLEPFHSALHFSCDEVFVLVRVFLFLKGKNFSVDALVVSCFLF